MRAFLVDRKLGNASPSRFLCFVRFSVLRRHKRLRGRHSSFRIVYACVSDDVGFGPVFSFVVLDVGQLVLISVAQYFSLDTLFDWKDMYVPKSSKFGRTACDDSFASRYRVGLSSVFDPRGPAGWGATRGSPSLAKVDLTGLGDSDRYGAVSISQGRNFLYS